MGNNPDNRGVAESFKGGDGWVSLSLESKGLVARQQAPHVTGVFVPFCYQVLLRPHLPPRQSSHGYCAMLNVKHFTQILIKSSQNPHEANVVYTYPPFINEEPREGKSHTQGHRASCRTGFLI